MPILGSFIYMHLLAAQNVKGFRPLLNILTPNVTLRGHFLGHPGLQAVWSIVSLRVSWI